MGATRTDYKDFITVRHISAIAAFLLGLLLLGLGIGQLASSGEDEDVFTQDVPEAPFTVVSDDLIDAEGERQEFMIHGDGEYTLAIGRAYDVEAWLDDAAYNRVGTVEESAESEDSLQIGVEHVEGEAQAPNPSGSDLWVETETVSDDLLYQWSAPDNTEDWALLIFVDGEQPAPVSLSIEPPADEGASGGAIALVVVGGVALLVGLGLFLRNLSSRRRAQTAGAAAGVVAIAAVSSLVLGQGAAPAQAQEEVPEDEDETDSQTEEVPEEGYSVLLASQLDRILAQVTEAVAEADAEQDADLLGSRISGHAAETRELAYRNHSLADSDLPAPIGSEVLAAVVTSDNEFPRSVVAITSEEETELPQILVLEQAAPRENYELVHVTQMAPGTEFPSYSAEQGGVTSVDTGEDSEIHELFAEIAEGVVSADADISDRLAQSSYLEDLHDYYQDLEESVADTELNLPAPSVHEDLFALELPDGNTIVSGSFDQVIQMAPLEDGDTIFLENELVESLIETDWTTFPTEITMGQSITVVIPADENDDIILLGADDIVSDASIETPEWFEGYDE